MSTDSAPREPEPLVLGMELAEARAAQARHQATPRGPSPLAGVRYDQPREELSLLRFTVVRTDEIIDEFVADFATLSGADRDARRASLTMDDFYTLVGYARRAAVRALRSGEDAVARRGAIALAAVDLDRVDWRDVAWQAGLLSYVLGRIGGNSVASAFTAAAALASGETATFLSSVAGRPPASLRSWGFREIQTAGGPGLIEDDGKRYRPKSDLIGLAEVVTAGLAGDIWQLDEQVIGCRPPAVWLRAGRQEEVDQALGSITGCVKLQGALASQDSPGEQAQHMLVFLAETRDPQAARVIAEAAGPSDDSFSFAALGIAADRLCAVMIARSFVQEAPSLETQASLERFRPVLAQAIERS